jgi:hypothetical protein
MQGPVAVSRWRMVAFLVTAIAWVPFSVVAAALLYFGSLGFGSENGDTAGAFDGGGAGITMAVVGLVMVGLRGAGLIALGQWAIRGKDEATAAGTVATLWAPSILLVLEFL